MKVDSVSAELKGGGLLWTCQGARLRVDLALVVAACCDCAQKKKAEVVIIFSLGLWYPNRCGMSIKKIRGMSTFLKI